jgi:transcriptional regulator with XRE-family HTH domain
MIRMARRIRSGRQLTGLYYAREARHMSRSELVRLSGVSKQQLSRLEGGQIRLRLDHLKPFAPHLGYSPEQMLLWGRYPGTDVASLESKRDAGGDGSQEQSASVNELNMRAEQGAVRARGARRQKDHFKLERWAFPASFVREQLHASAEQLVMLEIAGDSMAPTIKSGDRVIIDTGHKTPTPDGLYAIRDSFGAVVVKRLQVLRGSRQMEVEIISDNRTHPTEEVALDDLEIVGKVRCCLQLL